MIILGTSKFNDLNNISFELAKHKIRTGDILFCSGNYLVSQLIRKLSGSLFSHVGLLVHWNEHILLVESVEDDGVRVVPLTHYLYNYENSNKKYQGNMYIARHEVIASPDFDKEKIKAMCERVIGLLNRNYDREEIGKIVARIGLGIGRHKSDDEYMCSEFVDECFKELGIELSRDSKGFIFPEHIASDVNVKALFEVSP